MLMIDDVPNGQPQDRVSLNFNLLEFWNRRETLRCLALWGICEKLFHREEKRKGKKGREIFFLISRTDRFERRKERRFCWKLESRKEGRKVAENYGLRGSFLLIASRNASSRGINWG